MKHKINYSQTRKAELNVYPTALMSNYPCKHFLFHNANKLILKVVKIRLLEYQISFHLAYRQQKEMSRYHTHLTMQSVLQ